MSEGIERVVNTETENSEIEVNIPKLIEYISNLSMLMIDIDKEKLILFLNEQNHLNLVKKFSIDPNLKLLAITKNENESNDEDSKNFI